MFVFYLQFNIRKMENTQIENLNTANITDWQRWHLSQINKDDHLSNELHESFETTLFHTLMDRHNKMALKVIALEKQVATLQNMPIKNENIIKEMNALQKERNDLFAKNSDLKRKNERLENERNDYFFKYVSLQHTLITLQKSYDNLKQLLQNLI